MIERRPYRAGRLALLAALTVPLTSCAEPEPGFDDKEFECTGGACDDPRQRPEDEFEYIVVGAGAGGGTLASSLARAGHSVLLLEAGDYAPQAETTSAIPALHARASEDPALSWQFFVSHFTDQDLAASDSKYEAEEQGIFYPRGSTVGGSTAVNAMIAVYPHESDWDHIADLTGDPSWRADRMRRYFVELERNTYLGLFDSEEGHGTDGWLTTSFADPTLALDDLKYAGLVKAAAYTAGDGFLDDLGQLLGALNRDLNDPSPGRDSGEGTFSIPSSIDRGRRVGSRDRILATIEQGFPLELRTRSLVTNVVFAEEPAADGTPRAVGVDLLIGGHLYRADRQSDTASPGTPHRVMATREVVLSAGAFNTPQLLMLSGIGPRAELERHGIDVRVDSPGVGSNLQDRYEVPVVLRADAAFQAAERCSFDPSVNDSCLQDWERGEGYYTTNGGIIGMVRRSETATTPDSDLFIFGVPGSFRGYYPGYSRELFDDASLFTWLVLKAHSSNRGTVRLRSADPLDTPLIHFAYYGDPATGVPPSGAHRADLDAVIEGIETIRELTQVANERTISASYEEVWPGPDTDTRQELEDFAMREAWGHHASCTAPIGADDDPMAVLDGRFRVRGVSGLRVVDASVFPRIPGFFPVVAVYMLGERASDLMLEDIGEPQDTRFVNDEPLAIPDRDERGVESVIEVPAGVPPARDPSVTVSITHSYRGDLVLTLTHEGEAPIVLLSRAGGPFNNVRRTFTLPAYEGRDLRGRWTLRVADHARNDTGTLDGWSLQLGE
ncbi:MAG: GMC oxidoreductase [Sandaracinaceae bacterium]